MLSVDSLSDLHATIRFVDAMMFLGLNNTHQDMSGADCVVLLDAINERLTKVATQLEQAIKTQH